MKNKIQTGLYKVAGILVRFASFVKKEYKYISMHEEKEKIKRFFDLKEIINSEIVVEKDKILEFGIVRAADNSLHSVLDITPIPFNSLDEPEREKILSRFMEFFGSLPFDITLVKRSVNKDLDKEISIFSSKIIHDLKKDNLLDLEEKVKDFIKFIRNYAQKHCNIDRKLYMVVAYNPNNELRKKEEADEAITRLKERIKFLSSSLEKCSLSGIIPLRSDQLINLYSSYIKDSIFTHEGYLTPFMWLKLYNKSKGDNEKDKILKISKKFNPASYQDVLDLIKHKIKEKGLMYFSELDHYFQNVTKEDKNHILKDLRDDLNINVIDDMYEYIGKKLPSIKEDELFDYIHREEEMKKQIDHIKVGAKYYRGLLVTGYPDKNRKDFLKSILSSNENIDISIHLAVSSKLKLILYLKRKMRELEDQLFVYYEKGLKNEALEWKKQSMLEKISQLEQEKIKTFDATIFFGVQSFNIDELNSLTDKLVNLAKSSNLILKIASKYQKEVMKSLAPVGINFLNRRSIILTNEMIGNNFMFTSD